MNEYTLLSERAAGNEIAVIGSILLDSRCLDEIRRNVKADAFFYDHCREAFQIACDLSDAGEEVDLLSILAKAKTFDRKFILQAMESTPTAVNAGLYAKLVTQESLRRNYVTELENAINELQAGQDPAFIASEVQSASEAIANDQMESGLVSASDACLELYEAMRRASEGNAPFVKTGFAQLDNKLSGGLIREGMHVLAARPGRGKTTFAINLTKNILEQGKRTLFITLEMSREQLTSRFTAIKTGKLTASQIVSNEIPENLLDEVTETLCTVSNYPLWFNKKNALDIKEIHFLAKQNKAEFVVIDYLGLMQHRDGGRSLYEKVTATSNAIKRMARSLGIPVLCLVQLNREVEGRKNDPPRLSDLRDSGAIEQDADTVMLLHSYESENITEHEATPVDVIIAKNRHGPTGKVEFNWYKRNGRFTRR